MNNAPKAADLCLTNGHCMRRGRRLCHTFTTIIGLIFGLVVPETVLARQPQEVKQQNSGTGASLGCPRQVTNQQETNQRHLSAVQVSFEEVIVPTAPDDQMPLFELQNNAEPMFWIENLIKSQHNEITSPLDTAVWCESRRAHSDPRRRECKRTARSPHGGSCTLSHAG